MSNEYFVFVKATIVKRMRIVAADEDDAITKAQETFTVYDDHEEIRYDQDIEEVEHGETNINEGESK